MQTMLISSTLLIRETVRWRDDRKPGRFRLDKNETNAWLDNVIGNNSVVSEWKENFRLSQPTPSLFRRDFVSRCRGSLRSWRDSRAGERWWSCHIMRVKFLLATVCIVFACRPLLSLLMNQLNKPINWTLHQSSHGLATRVHGFATKTKALASEIPPATQAIVEVTNSLLITHFILNVPGVIVVCKLLGIRMPLSVNANKSEYSKTDESGNIYDSGKISSSVNLAFFFMT